MGPFLPPRWALLWFASSMATCAPCSATRWRGALGHDIERWEALNHLVAVNELLGKAGRVGMTNRPGHGPTKESNAVLYAFFEHFLQAGK
jgi:hypothetical protein